jgi:hypothetical protein
MIGFAQSTNGCIALKGTTQHVSLGSYGEASDQQ